MSLGDRMLLLPLVTTHSPTVLLFLLLLLFALLLTIYLYDVYWSRPGKVLDLLRHQGVPGPRRRFPTGNLLDIRRTTEEQRREREASSSTSCDGGRRRSLTSNYAPALFPYFEKWRKEYGPVFAYSTGSIVALYVGSPEMVRDMSQCVSMNLGKAKHLQRAQEPLFGRGILKANGEEWAYQRKVVAPEFFMNKVKGMVDLISEAAAQLVDSWEQKLVMAPNNEDGVEVAVDGDLRSFSADVISRACFGSNYARGKDIFLRLRALQKAMANPSFLFRFPHFRFLPSRQNREVRKLVREVGSLILKVVEERRDREKEHMYEKDLLQSILENAPGEPDGFVVDNCKNIYFAGHETTAVSATWCLMLLAAHQEWQERLRTEVIDVCGTDGKLIDVHMLPKMKTLAMVIQETLRLFPPSPFVSRETFEDMEFGGLHVPKGTSIWIPIATLHHDKEIWGPDADEFNPERFTGGVYGACSRWPHAYIPFGLGARKCVGQNLALVELKIVVAIIIARFKLALSPKYRHSPAFRLSIGPEFGLQLVLKKV